MLIHNLILTCCRKIKAKRTTAAIYYILTGKKSVQTMQDIHIFELQAYYGVAQSLSKQYFHKLIQQLEQHDLLDIDEDACFRLTEKGVKWLKSQTPPANFNGLRYHQLAPIFSDRLLLLIQTLTNSNMGNYRFIPIVDKKPVQGWVKSFYKMVKTSESDYMKALYKELHMLLSTLSEDEANLFVDRLTGYQIFGKSKQQLAEKYQSTIIDVSLIWMRIIHQMLAGIQNDTSNYPILHMIIRDCEQQSFFTNTARKTYHLLRKNYTIPEIAAIRGLKENTIHDHIVEIALADPTFSISPFIDREQYQEIIAVMEQIDSYSLKQIKEALTSDIGYFQIRLVLATIKRE